MTTPDGALQPARRRLEDAVSALCDPKPVPTDQGTRWVDPLYQQLQDSLPGNRGTGGTNAGFAGCWITALDLLTEIDTAVSAWQTTGIDTPHRLALIETRSWRPQDCTSIDQITAACQAWAESIRTLLNPTPHWTLPSPCPACGTRTVYRHDSGDQVRTPALQVGPHGCQCGKCKTVWAPDKFVFLARLLGYELPDGVLE